jgi:hypothetical protein
MGIFGNKNKAAVSVFKGAVGRRPKKAGVFKGLIGTKSKSGRVRSKARMGPNGISFT